jgi:hypothetical protein
MAKMIFDGILFGNNLNMDLNDYGLKDGLQDRHVKIKMVLI